VLSLGWAAAEGVEALAPLASVPHVNLSSNIGPLTQVATIVVPVATVAESSGAFTNAQGMVQSFKKAVTAPLGITSGWETLAAIAEAAGLDLKLKKLADVRGAMPADSATAPAE